MDMIEKLLLNKYTAPYSPNSENEWFIKSSGIKIIGLFLVKDEEITLN